MFWRELYSVEEAGNHTNSMDRLTVTAPEKNTLMHFNEYISLRRCVFVS